MFGDWDWLDSRNRQQRQRYRDWLEHVARRRLVILEFGAGLAVPTVRHECESQTGQLIRVNPRDSHGPAETISIPLGALETLQRIDDVPWS